MAFYWLHSQRVVKVLCIPAPNCFLVEKKHFKRLPSPSVSPAVVYSHAHIQIVMCSQMRARSIFQLRPS